MTTDYRYPEELTDLEYQKIKEEAEQRIKDEENRYKNYPTEGDV